MGNKLASKLDECLEGLGSGRPVGTSPEKELKPLLKVASALAAMPWVEPSPQFRESAQGRLMARLGQEASRVKVAEIGQRMPVIDDLADAGERMRRSLTRVLRVAVPVTLTLLVAVVLVFTASNLREVPVAYASECTLSIIGGNVEITNPGAASQAGADGMTLQPGTHVRTSADSHAILTFFDGSTLTLEPNTDIEVKQVTSSYDTGITIIMKQWAGRTWSRVVKMADVGSRYEIETPTATAIVRGTLFTTAVDEQGQTTVSTTEGLVSVAAGGEEVFVPPQQQTSVTLGGMPAPPSASPEADSKIVVHIGPEAVGSVVDPSGASTGHLRGGTAFNQITGSQYLKSEDGGQDIVIPTPQAGDYNLVLRLVGEDAVRFNITSTSAGQVTFSYDDTCGGDGAGGYTVKFRLDGDNGSITGGQVNGIEPLGSINPEKVVAAQPVTRASLNAKAPDKAGALTLADNLQETPVNSPVITDIVKDGDTPSSADTVTSEATNTADTDNSGKSDVAPGQVKDTMAQASLAPGQTGNTPGQSGNTPGQGGSAPGQSGNTPGQSGNTPGQDKKDATTENTTPPEITTTAPGKSGDHHPIGHADWSKGADDPYVTTTTTTTATDNTTPPVQSVTTTPPDQSTTTTPPDDTTPPPSTTTTTEASLTVQQQLQAIINQMQAIVDANQGRQADKVKEALKSAQDALDKLNKTPPQTTQAIIKLTEAIAKMSDAILYGVSVTQVMPIIHALNGIILQLL